MIGNEGAVWLQLKEILVLCTVLIVVLVVPLEKHQWHTCSHIQHISDIIRENSYDDIPQFLQPFVSVLNTPNTTKTSLRFRLLSRTKIPFTLSQQIGAVLRKPLSVRFSYTSGVCHLIEEDLDSPCTICGLIAWTSSDIVSDSVVVTQNQTLPAKGKQYRIVYMQGIFVRIRTWLSLSVVLCLVIVYSKRCTTLGCNGKLEFDGQAMGLLCFKSLYCL